MLPAVTERHATLTVWEDGFDWTPSEPLPYADPHVPGAPAVTLSGEVVGVAGRCRSAFAARELIPSWNARTPAGTWLLVEVRVASGEQRLVDAVAHARALGRG